MPLPFFVDYVLDLENLTRIQTSNTHRENLPTVAACVCVCIRVCVCICACVCVRDVHSCVLMLWFILSCDAQNILLNHAAVTVLYLYIKKYTLII